jgi:hypothetical protein
MSVPGLVSSLTEQDAHYLRNDGLIYSSPNAPKSQVINNLTVLDAFKVQGTFNQQVEYLTVTPNADYGDDWITDTTNRKTLSLSAPITVVKCASVTAAAGDYLELILPTPGAGIDGLEKTIIVESLAGSSGTASGVVIHGPVTTAASAVTATNGMEYFAAKGTYGRGIPISTANNHVRLIWVKKMNSGSGYWCIASDAASIASATLTTSS